MARARCLYPFQSPLRDFDALPVTHQPMWHGTPVLSLPVIQQKIVTQDELTAYTSLRIRNTSYHSVSCAESKCSPLREHTGREATDDADYITAFSVLSTCCSVCELECKAALQCHKPAKYGHRAAPTLSASEVIGKQVRHTSSMRHPLKLQR